MKHNSVMKSVIIGVLLALVIGGHLAWAQFEIEPFFQRDDPEDDRPGEPEFIFVRGIYSNYGGYAQAMGPARGWWETDFDDSDRNFLRGVQRYTNLDANSFGVKALELTDPELFKHTFLYINMKRVPITVPNSGPNFSLAEAEALREFM